MMKDAWNPLTFEFWGGNWIWDGDRSDSILEDAVAQFPALKFPKSVGLQIAPLFCSGKVSNANERQLKLRRETDLTQELSFFQVVVVH